MRGNTPDGGLWTADVLAERGKHRIAFEVQWSPQNQEETAQRQERYRNSGVRGLWLMSRPSGLQISKEVPSLLVQVDLDTRTANIKIPAMESMGLTDHLVKSLVAGLQREHQAWISVFNKRVNHLDARDA